MPASPVRPSRLLVAALSAAAAAVMACPPASALAAPDATATPTPVLAAPARAFAHPDPSRGAAPTRPVTPVARYYVSGRFGERGSHWRLRHTGLDFVAGYGTPVRAVATGRVVKLAWNRFWGRMVILEVSPGVTVWYCHLSKVLVRVGAVARGQVLGRIGTSGNSTGPHLHLEVRVHDRPTNPATYLFGSHAGTPGAVPSWYPATPISTVANLATLR